MNWLLKIVEGPMKGAEVALVAGFKVKVGSDDACDVVIADRSLDAVAFELDVAESGVVLELPSGETKGLAPFEVAVFGTTAVAVGPSEGKWKPLVWPARAADEKSESAAAPAAAEEAPPAAAPAETKRRRAWGCLVWPVALILLGVAVWYFWPSIVRKYPKAEDCRTLAAEKAAAYWEKVLEMTKRGTDWARSQFEVPAPEPVVLPTLAEIAADHGLDLVTDGETKTLRGNCQRRTERMAIRALALASDPTVRFDLTDDESLKTAADELLFVVTEGSLKAVAASNRVVTVEGAVADAKRLERVIRALNADVPGIERLETSGVKVGGVKAAGGTPVAAGGAPAPKMVARRDYPIAGILVSPYPCVVMRTGLRLAEGAQIGTAVIERIEADRLVLRDGHATFEWRP